MLAVGLIVGAASISLRASAGTLEDVKAAGSATIAIATSPPWMNLEPDGSLSGVGPEIDKAILETQGINKVDAQVMEYGAMIPAVQARRVTFATGAALYIRPERCQAVIFSNPITCSGEGFILRSDLVGKVKSYKDVADLGLTIGVCAGCSEQTLATQAGVSEDHIVVWPDATSAMKLLADKRIDVLAHDQPSALDLQKKNGTDATQVILVEGVPLACSAAAFHKEDVSLRDAYNEGFKKVVASGKYLEIMTKYGLESLVPGLDGMTTDALCK
jgi:polar amino acid transport system substrate-binding protein